MPLPRLSDEILENTFMDELVPWVRAKVECREPVGLMNMMEVAQSVENREVVQFETISRSIDKNNEKNKVHGLFINPKLANSSEGDG